MRPALDQCSITQYDKACVKFVPSQGKTDLGANASRFTGSDGNDGAISVLQAGIRRKHGRASA